MKKYTMLIITITMIFLTSISYIYDHRYTELPTITVPSIHINSSKFGIIKEVVWLDSFVSADAALLVLSSQENQGGNYSSLFYLNIDSGHSMLLSEFPSHKYLDNIILFDNTFSSQSIITPYKDGIVKTTLQRDNINDEELTVSSNMIAIEGFENADSMDYKGQLFFSKSTDKLLHIKDFHTGFFPNIFHTPSAPDYKTFYRDPYFIVNANLLDRVLTYTSVNKNSVDLYSMGFDGAPVTKFNLPLIKNIVTAEAIEDGYGFIGMNTVDKEEELNIFMVRRSINHPKDLKILDQIPFHTDVFGGIPSIDSITFNEDYTLVYTYYDENHQGKLKVNRYNEEPKVIIEDKNLFGPIRIASKRLDGDDKRTELILYFTSSDEGIKAKICDVEGNLVKDITGMLM
ncbi:hypothetical protein [Clostridium formicaceticum]|uniref:Uncharacterized protein n=1 Tax=Clostridium formicaceticum TaxID=1497 RepID=A0AAC9RJM9_9CLOT|nr:hypothetical protein [Clostridium formicaceticum]AOY77730.1 hypothetical protein BJL90_18830 [Clostridium formicaceticum]ARE88324.1 hypothetical protein CLFO_27250 [Clostridium formicaceticum]